MGLGPRGAIVYLLALSPSVPLPHPRLQNCQLTVQDVEMLIAQLQEGPQLDEVE